MDLHGRSVLLTGAGSGIGRALALQLADQQPRLDPGRAPPRRCVRRAGKPMSWPPT